MKIKQKKALQAVAFRMNADIHATLRTVAFDRRMPMVGLVEEIIENWIKINKIKRVKHFIRH